MVILRIVFKPFGPFRRVCGASEIPLTLEHAHTVNDVIQELLERFGPDLQNLLIEDGTVNGNVIIMLNKRDIATLGGLDTPIRDGDEIAILPHVQGGAD